MQKEFIRQIELHEAVLKKYKVIFGVVGYIKLFLVLLLGLVLYFIFSKGFLVEFIIVGLIELISLVVLWVYHNRVHKKIDYSNGIVAINKRHIDRISGKWSNFTDTGAEFINLEHPYASDLDIVGKKSFFQFLNTTHTWHGRQTFANDLLQPHYSKEALEKRQVAIVELSKDMDFSNHMEYTLSKISADSSAQKLVDELKDRRAFIKNKAIKFLLMYAPLPTFISIAVIIVFGQKSLYMVAASVAAIQVILWIIGMPKTQKYLGAISRLPYKLGAYCEVIDILKNKDFDSEKLKQIQSQLGTLELSAAQAIKELSKISDKMSVRNNGIIWFAMNMFLLWDYECTILFRNGRRNTRMLPRVGFSLWANLKVCCAFPICRISVTIPVYPPSLAIKLLKR